MKKYSRFTALVVSGALALGLMVPAAQAATIQPLTYPISVNNSPVSIENSINYGGHTYVQLRELASVTNMKVNYIPVGSNPSWLMHDGPVPEGANLSLPSFIYVKDVKDYKGNVNDGKNFTGVDITEVYERYKSRDGYAYGFDDHGDLVVPDGNGGEKTIDVQRCHISDKVYVTTDEYRDKIQPYMLDLCMQ